MILGRDSLTGLVLNIRLYDHVIKADDGPLKVLTSPMADLGMYELKILNTGKITPEELFMNYYKKYIHELEEFCTSNKLLHVFLDADKKIHI